MTSPTFTCAGSGRTWHIDLYRLGGATRTTGLMEWLDEPQGALVVVEWFERLGPAVAEVRVRIEVTAVNVRRVEIDGPPALAVALRRRSG